jgi:hypothetical protein
MNATRRSREVWVSTELIERFLSSDEVKPPHRVVGGIDPEAKIVGARMVNKDTIAILYDRPVHEPSFEMINHWPVADVV